jgi:hypothetical protein
MGALNAKMAKKLTQEEFLAKAVATHGAGRYDYSQVAYLGTKDKIKIVCPEHGEFKQEAKSHVMGHGCPACGQVQSNKIKADRAECDAKATDVEALSSCEWRVIPGYKEHYKVSEHGQVYSSYRPDSLISARTCPITGYVSVGIKDANGKNKTARLHRLVALAFLPNPLNLPQINHINGIKTENGVLNLEWCDAAHNMQHAVVTGLVKPAIGEKSGRCKLSTAQVGEIRLLLSQGMRMVKIAAMYNVSPPQIRRIKLGILRANG